MTGLIEASSVGWPLVLVAVVSFGATGCLIALAKRLPSLSGGDARLEAIQAAHANSTPRVGGIAIFAAMIVAIFFVDDLYAIDCALFLVAASVLFLAGLLEDLGVGVSPLARLGAALVASLIAAMFFGTWLARVDIIGVDPLVSIWFFGIPLTLLLTVGIANGFNLIDGVNGLAGLTGIIASTALAVIAHQSGEDELAVAGLFLAASTFGFFAFNFPFGFIFLGDSGAYTLGFCISWLAIFIVEHSGDVTPWAGLLTVLWPVFDTLLAMYRRRIKKGETMAPDKLHVHQLVMRALGILVFGRSGRHISNPLTTLILAPFVAAPAVTAVFVWDDATLAFSAVCLFTGFYLSCYVLAFRILNGARRYRVPHHSETVSV